MKKQIIINASKDRSRIAIVENGELVELYVENPDNVRTIGNIYLGRIQKVMPAIRAAFVDVGQKQDCFLHFSDLTDNFPQLLAIAGEEVPGLDEPVLSLAPSKRVADDESEPDIEDKLEVEPAEDESQTRRRSRGRRSRGRGRGRGRGRRREEEEEQEEPKKLPSVIDLTRPSQPRRAPAPPASEPDPASEPAPEAAPASDASAPAPEAAEALEAEVAPEAEEAPRSRRKSRTPAGDAPEADTPDAEVTDAEAASEEAAAEDEGTSEPNADGGQPKRRRRRRRRGGRGRNRGGQKADPADDGDATPAKADAHEGESAQADTEPQTDAPAEEPASDPTADRPTPLPATLDLTGSATKARDAASGRSRRRSRGSAPDDDTAASGPDAEADAPKETASGRSRRSRGRSKTAQADASSDASTTEAGSSAGAESSTEAEPSGRSRRGRRGANDNPGTKGTDRSDSGRSDSGRGRGGRGGPNGRSKSNVPIPPSEQLLKRDGRIIVKITKEPISTKGPRVSTDLSLAGRFLVLVPAADYVAVSKKIESAKERRRLRTLATSLKPEGFGVIVRTVAEGRDAKSLDTDLRLLVEKWRKIDKKLQRKPQPPVLLYEDVNMVSSIIRDLFSEDYDRILVDDPKVFKNVQAYVKAVAPAMADKVEMHKGRQPVFRSLGIEKQVEEAFSKRVNMRGGGYLYIETTEAMHVVDVNSGRAGRGKSQKENLIAVNVEAAKEIAKQLRLRDLGGIIVVDFIDLRYDRDRKKVTDALKEAFKRDRAVTKLLPMSDFGLVQITRQRLRPSITTQATAEDGQPLDASEAAAAAGAGEIRQARRAEPEPREAPRREEPAPEADRPPVAPEDATPQALSGRLKGWLDHYRRTVDDRYRSRPIVVRVHPLFGAYLRRGFPSPLTRWRLSLRGIAFHLEEDAGIDPLGFEVRDQKSGRSLLKKYSQ
ncbi:MAG: Rne/Rng family ribonuclease [Bacteroidota bacterium]